MKEKNDLPSAWSTSYYNYRFSFCFTFYVHMYIEYGLCVSDMQSLPVVVLAVRSYDAKNQVAVLTSVTIVKLHGIPIRHATRQELNGHPICAHPLSVGILKLVSILHTFVNCILTTINNYSNVSGM